MQTDIKSEVATVSYYARWGGEGDSAAQMKNVLMLRVMISAVSMSYDDLILYV